MLSRKTRLALIKAGVALTISFASVGTYSVRTYGDVVNSTAGTLTVKASSIWTYSAPDWNAKTRTYPSGTVFEVTEKHNVEGRYMYRLDSGLYITANEAYVTFAPMTQTEPEVQPPAEVTADTRKTIANLNMRTGPGTTFAIITTIPKDSEVRVESEAGGWAKVEYGGKSGYVSTSYLTQIAAAPAPVPEPQPEPVPAPETAAFERKTTVNLNMRTGPGTSYGIITTIPKDTSVSAEAEADGWVKVNYSGKTGYVSAQYLTQPAVIDQPSAEPDPVPETPSQEPDPVTEDAEAPATDDVRTTTANLNLRSGEGTSYPVIMVIPSGTSLSIESITGTWAKVTYSGETGYVSVQYLTQPVVAEPTEPEPDPVTEVPEAPASDDWRSTTANLNLRSGEGASYPIIKVIPSGTLLNVEADTGSWAKVTYGGNTGYAATAYLIKSEAPATGEDIVEYASQFLGVPYVWAGNTPESGFDCSGFTRYVYANFGISLPRISRDQAKTGTAVTEEERKPGDLLYFGSSGYVDHVGIYAGDNNVIHASSTNKMVVISSLQYYTATYMGARRLLNP